MRLRIRSLLEAPECRGDGTLHTVEQPTVKAVLCAALRQTEKLDGACILEHFLRLWVYLRHPWRERGVR